MKSNNREELKMFQVYRNNAEGEGLIFKIARAPQNPSTECLAPCPIENSQLAPEHNQHRTEPTMKCTSSIGNSQPTLEHIQLKSETPLRHTSSTENSEPTLKHIREYSTSISTLSDSKMLFPSDFKSDRSKVPEGTAIQEDMKSISLPKVEMFYSPVKQEDINQGRRRSLRLQAKLNSLQGSNSKNSALSNGNGCAEKSYSDSKVKQHRDYKKTTSVSKKSSKMNKQKKTDLNVIPVSTSGSKDIKKICITSQTLERKFIEPSKMRLKRMRIIPTAPKGSQSASDIVPKNLDAWTPKFANVDPSRILSTLSQQGNTVMSPKRPMPSTFTNKNPTIQDVKPAQDYASKGISMHHCRYNKKAKKDIPYLYEKYHMLDNLTLDNCYGLSNGSLMKTEILLWDIISGKEINFSRKESDLTQNFSPFYVSNANHFSIMNPQLMESMNSPCCQNSENLFYQCDSLYRKIIVQSMNILYSEESVL